MGKSFCPCMINYDVTKKILAGYTGSSIFVSVIVRCTIVVLCLFDFEEIVTFMDEGMQLL